MKVTEKCADQSDGLVFICDFSPPRGAGPDVFESAGTLDADFILVAYNPGRAVRVDSAMLAASIRHHTGKNVAFTMATRDMNLLALQSHALGAQQLGLENVIVVGGDSFSEKDRTRVQEVRGLPPTRLIETLGVMNQGTDFRGSNLRAPTDLCIGATMDLSRGIEREAALARRKVEAGAHFFITQPVFSTGEVSTFQDAYGAASGGDLSQPVFFGVQVLVKDGVLFSSVPESARQDLEKGRDGADMALELLADMFGAGIRRIYLMPPILKGGGRDYEVAQRVLQSARRP